MKKKKVSKVKNCTIILEVDVKKKKSKKKSFLQSFKKWCADL